MKSMGTQLLTMNIFQKTQNSMENHTYNKNKSEAISNKSHQKGFKKTPTQDMA